MEKINVKVRKWGNSFGIILPKRVVDNQNLTEGIEIEVIIQPKKSTKVKDLIALSKKLGLNKKLKNTDTQKIHNQLNKELWPEEK
ncbi:MAG: AbrB/MazE/SpoVT family DNA-binding domain-containing protein [Nanoarchaeota archaeon]|nr:AbrB/MazE/SpoVT family DNA-binding domain-containing protein [Nanoarchaeota archaeon]MBU0978007.1 AbrB/MazE/SpoVT family DNA-binding domain-containing protein [Nanoarchaeota archaeon]